MLGARKIKLDLPPSSSSTRRRDAASHGLQYRTAKERSRCCCTVSFSERLFRFFFLLERTRQVEKVPVFSTISYIAWANLCFLSDLTSIAAVGLVGVGESMVY